MIKQIKPMKKIISVFLLISILSIAIALPMNARGICPPGQHGPTTLFCSGSLTYDSRSHTYYENGYARICSYVYVLAYTSRRCENSDCGNVEANLWTHSHGYRNHDTGCGWINSSDDTCFLR